MDPSQLPPVTEQDDLIGELASRVRSRGFVPLVSAPLLEPRPRYFPDAWRHRVIPENADRCPGCSGMVSGRIAHEDERIDARMRLEGDDDESNDASPEEGEPRGQL